MQPQFKAELIMEIHPIHTEQDYEKALDRIEEIFDAKAVNYLNKIFAEYTFLARYFV